MTIWCFLRAAGPLFLTIDRPTFLGDAKSGFRGLVGIQNKTTGEWNLVLVPEFTPPVSPGVTDRIKCRLPGSDQANAPVGNPIAFFTALQIISREKGFWRKSNIRNFSALNATALAS